MATQQKQVVPVTLIRGKDSKRYARFEFPEELKPGVPCPFVGSLYVPLTAAGDATTWFVQVAVPTNGQK